VLFRTAKVRIRRQRQEDVHDVVREAAPLKSAKWNATGIPSSFRTGIEIRRAVGCLPYSAYWLPNVLVLGLALQSF
jgi:hypothetical protein